MRGLRSLLIGVLVLLLAGTVPAATLTFSDDTGTVQNGWIGELRLQKFDPALGTLNSITFEYGGTLIASVAVESMNGTPAHITTTVEGEITFYPAPYDLIPYLRTWLQCNRSFDATAYDGVLDYGGTSGITFPDDVWNGSTGGFSNLSDPTYLSLFTGLGQIAIPCEVSGTSVSSGPANLAVLTRMVARGQATVIYDYTPVPEPSGILALLPGIAGLVGVLRMRRR